MLRLCASRGAACTMHSLHPRARHSMAETRLQRPFRQHADRCRLPIHVPPLARISCTTHAQTPPRMQVLKFNSCTMHARPSCHTPTAAQALQRSGLNWTIVTVSACFCKLCSPACLAGGKITRRMADTSRRAFPGISCPSASAAGIKRKEQSCMQQHQRALVAHVLPGRLH